MKERDSQIKNLKVQHELQLEENKQVFAKFKSDMQAENFKLKKSLDSKQTEIIELRIEGQRKEERLTSQLEQLLNVESKNRTDMV